MITVEKHLAIMDDGFTTNTYIVTDTETGDTAVVDPSLPEEKLMEKLSGKNVKYILLTHGHFDHFCGAKMVKDGTGAKVVIHEKDAGHLLDPKKSLAEGNFPESHQPVTADILVEDGDVIMLGNSPIKVMHTPGHTNGSVCYILEDERVIFSGDTLFCMTAGRTDFWDGSDEKMIASLKRLIALDGDYKVYAGHSRETTLERERTRNWYIRRMVK